MQVRFQGGPLDGEIRNLFTPARPRWPITEVQGGGWSNVDSFYELDEHGVYHWRGPQE